LYPFFFWFCDEIKPLALQFGKRGQEVKIKRSRTVLRHLTVKNDGRIEMRGIKRKNAVWVEGGVEIARV
jgi:hypothetical protein